jgi:hypothetical protein
MRCACVWGSHKNPDSLSHAHDADRGAHASSAVPWCLGARFAVRERHRS